MSKELNDLAPSGGEVSTLYVALEVSGTSWVVGIGDPGETDKVGMHKLAPADTDGLLEKIGKACAGADGPSRVLLTYEAGYEGFWLAPVARRARAGGRRRDLRSGESRGGAQEEAGEDGPD